MTLRQLEAQLLDDFNNPKLDLRKEKVGGSRPGTTGWPATP